MHHETAFPLVVHPDFRSGLASTALF